MTLIPEIDFCSSEKFGIVRVMSEKPDALHESKLYVDAAREELRSAKLNRERLLQHLRQPYLLRRVLRGNGIVESQRLVIFQAFGCPQRVSPAFCQNRRIFNRNERFLQNRFRHAADWRL